MTMNCEEKAVKVLGIGGSGCNFVESMIDMSLKGVEFIIGDTDSRSLNLKSCPLKLFLYEKCHKEFGCGGNPEIGFKSTLENKNIIKAALKDTDILMIVAGMGGGTGTGGAPVVAQISREIGIWTIAIVTTPFRFEGRRRVRNAEKGILELKEVADMTIIVPNQQFLPRFSTFAEVIRGSGEAISAVVRAFADLLQAPSVWILKRQAGNISALAVPILCPSQKSLQEAKTS